MQIKIDTNAKDIARRIGKKGKELSDSVKYALSRTALKGKDIIQDRMTAGEAIKGGNFKKYDSVYAAFRSSKGRGTKPDLQFTGQMFSAITTKSNSKQAEIFFSRAQEAKKAAMNNKSRPFFGFSRSEERMLGSVFFRALK